MNRKRLLSVLSMISFLASGCALGGLLPTPTPACPEPCTTQTIIKIKFPFEPSFPGYIVEIKSKDLAADLICALEQDTTTGEVLSLNDEPELEGIGVCDVASMTITSPLKAT